MSRVMVAKNNLRSEFSMHMSTVVCQCVGEERPLIHERTLALEMEDIRTMCA